MRTGGVVLFGVRLASPFWLKMKKPYRELRVERFESERRTEIMTGYDWHGPRAPTTVSTPPLLCSKKAGKKAGTPAENGISTDRGSGNGPMKLGRKAKRKAKPSHACL